MTDVDNLQIFTIIAIILSGLLIYLLNRFKNSITPVREIILTQERVNTGKQNDIREDIWEIKTLSDEEYSKKLDIVKKELNKKMVLYLLIYLSPIIFILLTFGIVINLYFGIFTFILSLVTTLCTEIIIKFSQIGKFEGY